MANAKLKYILDLENNAKLKPIIAEVQQAANGFDGLKAKIETSARSLGLMQRELSAMQGTFNANKSRIKELEQALNLASISATQDEKANAKLRNELDRLTATNAKLANSIERKSISIQRASANLAELGKKAGDTGRKLDQIDTTTAKQSGTLAGLGDQIKGLAGAYLGLEVVAQAASFAFEGFKLGANIEQSRMMIQTLVQDVDKGNKIFDEAIKFGQKYGYTQEEMASAASQAATIINKTNQTTEKSLEVLGRLASLNPAEGFEGAVIAFKELASGDITSIAERFNIARSEANAMKQAIADGADPVVVLDQALANMGVTSDVLANRMKGSNGALLEVKLAFEDSKLAAGEFLETIGAPEMLENFARGLKYVNDGLRNFILQLAKAGGQGRFGVQAGVTDAGSYQAYVDGAKQLQAENEKAKQSFLGIPGAATNLWTSIKNLASGYDTTAASARILTQQEWALRQALIEKGLGADDAAQSAINLTMIQNGLVASTNLQIQTQGLNAEEQDRLNQSTVALQQSIMTLAMAHPELIDQIEQVVVQTALHGGSTEELALKIETLTTATELNIATQEALAIAEADVADASAATTASVYQLTDAQYENANAKLVQGLEAERARQFEEDLALAVAMSAGGALDAEIAAIRLAQAYGIERSEAANLIAMTNELNAARSGRMGSVAGRALEGTLNRVNGVRSGAITAPYQRPERGGRKKGGRTGKSEEVKAAEKEQKDLAKAEKSIETARQNHNKKLEDIDKKHAAELIKINVDYIQKALAAEQKFNTDKFAIRNSFKQSLFDLDRDLYDAAREEEVKYWDESQAIAQAGDATKAADLLAAGQELAQMRADHAQQLRDIDAEIANAETEAEAARLADRKLRMEEAYAEEQRLAEENINKIRNGEDTLKSERDQSIADEQRDYDKARSEADTKFQEDIAKIVEGYDVVDEATERTKQAIIDMANAAVAGLQAVANVPAGAPASVEAAAGRAFGGNVRAGTPYTVGEFGREVFVPRQSGTILNQRQLDRAMNRGSSPTFGTPRNGRQETINRDEMIINVTGTAKEITQAEAAIERIAERVYDRRMKLTVNRVVTKRPR